MLGDGLKEKVCELFSSGEVLNRCPTQPPDIPRNAGSIADDKIRQCKEKRRFGGTVAADI